MRTSEKTSFEQINRKAHGSHTVLFFGNQYILSSDIILISLLSFLNHLRIEFSSCGDSCPLSQALLKHFWGISIDSSRSVDLVDSRLLIISIVRKTWVSLVPWYQLSLPGIQAWQPAGILRQPCIALSLVFTKIRLIVASTSKQNNIDNINNNSIDNLGNHMWLDNVMSGMYDWTIFKYIIAIRGLATQKTIEKFRLHVKRFFRLYIPRKGQIQVSATDPV